MRFARGIAVAAAGVVLATSGPGAVVADEGVTVTGTYQRMAKEVGEGHAYDDLLVTPSRTYRLRLRGAPPRPGSTVRVSAMSTDGGRLDVTRTTTLSPSATQPAIGPTTTLAILAHWTTPDAMTQTAARTQLFSDGNAWLKEVSYGQTSLSGAVTPWVKISPPTNGQCYTYAEQIMARAKAGAANLGYYADHYHRTLVYFPRCSGTETANMTGWAYEPGDSIWLNGVMDRRTAMHEHGHSFGMGHARSLACTANGVRVTLSSTCAVGEYGDPYDAMGNSGYAGHYTALHKDQAGWLGGTRKHVMRTTSGTFTIPPFEKPSTLPLTIVANGANVGRRYWVEYRQPIGMDARFPAGATGGAMIHYEDTPIRGQGSFLLDPTPADASFATVALGPGRSWRSPDGVTIAVNSVSTSGANVTITGARPEPVPPSPPRSVTAQPGHGRVLLSWQPPASDGNSPVSRYVVGVSNGGLFSVPPDKTSFLVTGLYNDTAYSLTVRAESEVGDGDPSAPVSATPRASTLAPVVTFRTPVPGATVSGTVRVTADVKADALLSAYALREFYVDGRRVRTAEFFDWPTLDYANGPHVLRVVGRDELDRATVTEATVHVLNHRPSVSFTAPAADATVTGGVVTLAVSAAGADDGAALDRVEFVNTSNGAVIGTARTAPYEVPWDVTYAVDGTYTLDARAFDTSGRSTTATIRVNVYHPPPTVSITSPAASTTLRGTSVTVVADARPGIAGRSIAHVTFTSSLGHVVDSVAPYEATFDTSAVTGSHWVDVRAVESPGGRAASAYGHLYFDNPLPSLTVASPSTYALRGQVITVSGTAKPSPTSGAAVQKVVLTAASGTTEAPVAADGTWSLPWDVKGRYGYVDITVTAVDAAGYRAKRTRTHYLERPLPAVTLVAPAEGAALTTEPTELVARVEPAADAVHGIAEVCFLLHYSRIACGIPGSDGLYRATVTLPPGQMPLRVWVKEADGHVTYQAERWIGVYGPPALPYEVTGESGPDARVTLRWYAPPATDYTPVDEYVVRDEHGTVVARGRSSSLTFPPPRVGTNELYTVEAVNRWGTTPRVAASHRITAKWYVYLDNVSLSRTTTTYPGTVTVTGRLTRFDGTPIGGQPLTVTAWTLRGTDDVVARTVPTSYVSGFASATFVPAGSGDVVLTWYGDAAHEGVMAEPVRVTVRALVTGNLTSGRMALGSTTTFNGRVQPAQRDRFVYLQRYYGGAWRTVTYRRQDAYGRVSIPIRPGARGSYTYRLFVGGDARRLGNTSPARTVYVY